MPSYQIYIPGERGAAPERLAAVGLNVHDRKVTCETIEGTGPDGGRGKFFYWLNPVCPEYAPTPGYYPEQQEWAPAKAQGDKPAGRFWMGKEKGAPVEPESILRREFYTSAPVELCDGQQWLVPAAPKLPRRIGLNDLGEPTRIVAPEFRAYCNQVGEFYKQFLAVKQQGSTEFDIKGAWPFAVATLQFNYRLDSNIVDWLGLLDDMRILELILRTFEGDMSELMDTIARIAGTKQDGRENLQQDCPPPPTS